MKKSKRKDRNKFGILKKGKRRDLMKKKGKNNSREDKKEKEIKN